MAWWDLLDRVKFVANERLDLVDARAITSVIQNQFQEALGALIGPASGCISTPIATYTTAGLSYYMALGPFQFYYAFEAERADGSLIRDESAPSPYTDAKQKAWRGMVITHDPSDDGQSGYSTIDITALKAIADAALDASMQLTGAWDDDVYPYLWARPFVIPAQTDARRKWDTSTSAEIGVSITTRERTRVEFRLQYTRPEAASGEAPFVKVARVLSYYQATHIPRIYPISFLDDPEIFAFCKEPGSSGFDGHRQAIGIGEFDPETGQEERYGAAPFEGHTSGMSLFLSPYPSFTGVSDATGDGFTTAGSTAGRQLGQPASLSLVAGMQLARSRIKAHMGGEDPLTHVDISPWWTRPKYGLVQVATKLDAIGDTSIPAVEARATALEGRATTLEGRTSVLEDGVRLAAYGEVLATAADTFTLSSGSLGILDIDVTASTSASTGSVAVRLDAETSTYFDRLTVQLTAIAQPGGVTFGIAQNGFSPTGTSAGVWAPKVLEIDWVTVGGSNSLYHGIFVRGEGTNAAGSGVYASGSFFINVFGRRS